MQDEAMTTVSQEAKQSGERAARSPWARGLARSGLAARGVMYALIGVLALKVALLGRGKAPDREAALRTVADEPFGGVLLSAIAVGIAGYALWQLARAVLGGNLEGGEEDDGFFKRIGYLARAVFYGAIFVSTVLIIAGSGGGSGGREEDKATAYVLDLPAGQLLVGAVGLAFIGAGLWNVYRGLSGKFREKLKLVELNEAEDKAYTAIGAVGFVARGVVFGLVGAFLIRAAYQYDPEEAVGLDGALSEIVHSPYGPYLLGLTAAGLFAFGLYSFVEARYREV
jgi:Domain of Unknown Function (DUF1206)